MFQTFAAFLYLLWLRFSTSPAGTPGPLGFIASYTELPASLSVSDRCWTFASDLTICHHMNAEDVGVSASEIEKDVYEPMIDSCQQQVPWHLGRIGTRRLPSISTYGSVYNGEGVEVYIVDTYIDLSHPQFEGRARLGFANARGQNPHGTHVAGIVASREYGVAKKAGIVSVQVLDERGYGRWSNMIEGLEWIARSASASPNNMTVVVNMSIGGTYSAVMNQAVRALWNRGIVVVVAAGNEAVDACTTSPASAHVITVGASSAADEYAHFSNWGRCVTVAAPGVSILSTLPGGGTGYMSGTSMASPLVAGLAALYVQANGYIKIPPMEVLLWLSGSSTKFALAPMPHDTANRLVYLPFTDPLCHLATIMDLPPVRLQIS